MPLALFESSVKPFAAACEQIHDLCQGCEAKGINQQRHSGWSRGGAPVRPFLRQAEAAEVGVPNTQRFDTRHFPDLQNDEPLTAQWMKRMRNFGCSQRFIVPKCSSM